MFQEALLRLTSHVQFLVVEREDQNKEGEKAGKLRETTSFFLLAYFFPGCEVSAHRRGLLISIVTLPKQLFYT